MDKTTRVKHSRGTVPLNTPSPYIFSKNIFFFLVNNQQYRTDNPQAFFKKQSWAHTTTVAPI